MAAGAWDRGATEIFTVVPYLPGNVPVSIEGLTVGPDGTVYTPSFGFNSKGEVKQPPHLFSFRPDGSLLYDKALVNPAPSPQPSPHLLGLVYQSSSKSLLICDLAQGIVWQANPVTGKATLFMDTGLGGNSGLNALTFDKAGNVYVSDSFQGVIWKTGPTGGAPKVFVDSQTLSPQAANGVILVPPFGANGVEFDHKFTAMFVANTAYHSIVKVPATLNHDGSVSLAGPAAVLTAGINAPDGIAVDRRDNLWVVANQQDEVDVIDPNAIDRLGNTLPKVIARRGDFNGLGKSGTIRGLLFPASRVQRRRAIPLCLQHRALPALRGSAGAGDRLAMDARSQALHDRQDPRRNSSVDRSGREIGGPSGHGRTAGASIGMPRARSIR